MRRFSFARFRGIVRKEFLQLRRDRLTFGMIIGVPILQLILFGYAINTDPKRLPTAIISADHSEFTRSYLAAMANSDYFALKKELPDQEAGRAALARGDVQFVLNIPAGFTRDLLRGERPALLLEADGTDPSALGSAIAATRDLVSSVAAKDLSGPLASLAQGLPPFEVRLHKLYNPEAITQRNIVPGLMGVILTMTMVMMTGLAMTRERERGTMENLLATPARPLEVMTGKILPYIAIGLIQATIILVAARYVFGVPIVGSLVSLYIVALVFIAAQLTVGITLSSIAQNQLQAMQLTFFYFLPNMLLSGFMFPFQGMPAWARGIGSLIPLTYFNRLVRGVLLKGNGWSDLWPNLWPLMVFTVVVMSFALRVYRKTLD
ncbi:MAG TPA: ABC transporter permease [Candidatus Polarisedimenticolia bacterium]|nr:ABC transporter permease [Candidatus Polarisedimenticolia bacterium]